MNRFTIKPSWLLLSLILAAGCGQGNQNQDYSSGPAEVPMDVVKEDTANISTEYSASIEGIANVEIRPQVSGYLDKIYVDEGDYVRAGQPLFSIEDRIFEQQLRNSKAALSSAQANLVTAKINLDRKRELVESKMVSEFQLQEAEATYNASKGVVEQAASAVESAQINLSFSTINAPVSGYVGRFNSRLGSLLSPSDPQPITIVSDISNVYAYFSMSENDFVDFQDKYIGNQGDKFINTPPVELVISNGSKYAHQGKIDAIDGQFNKSTGSIALRAKFRNPDFKLRSGNTGKIVINQKFDNVVVIPIASTMALQDKLFIFSVDKEGKSVQLPIEVSGKSGDKYIVSAGIKPGDSYIVAGFERLQPGTAVVEQKAQQQQQY